MIVIFFLIYRSANPLFQKYTEKINLNFISFAWCIFTFCGFFIIWGLIRHQRISFVDIWENNQPLTLNPHKTYSSSKWNEKTSATLLFFVLNVMLLLINLLDINFLYLNQGMPEGINHADFVHNGVGMLILSIVMAISILLYFFRGGLNFEEKNQNLKRLVYFWIAQNVLMVISTMVRNNLYIQEYTLTYRRIGVYVWLFMAAIGLISTALKIMKARSNWYLFRVNALAAYLVLVVASCIDWDRFLTVYNIHHTKSLAALDKTYLLSLSESNIPDLLIIKDFKDINKDSSWHYRWYDSDSELSFSSGSRLVNNSGNIDYKLYEYLQRTCDMGWRSWSIRQYTIYKAVATLNRMRKIKVLDLGGHSIKNLKPLAIVNQAEELNLSHSGLCTLEEIRLFPCLKKLNLSFSNSLTNIKELKSLPALNSLNVENTRLNSITPIFDKVFLKELNLKNCGVHELRGLEKLSKLEYLWLSAVQEKDILYLKQLKALKTLTVSACGADIVEKLKAALPNCKVNQDTIQANNNR